MSANLTSLFIEKLWNTVFGSGVEGVSLAWDTQIDIANREQQRAREWEHIGELETDIRGLYHGNKFIENGKIQELDLPEASRHIAINPLLENDAPPLADSPKPNIVTMLKLVKREEGLRALSRMINVRKILLTAEVRGVEWLAEEMSAREVHQDWLARWRAGAEDAHSDLLQKFWAVALAREVIEPGKYSFRTLEFLRTMSPAEAEMITLAAKLNLDGFIHRVPGSYFSPSVHKPMFALLQDLELIRDEADGEMVLHSHSKKDFRQVLRCGNKALFLEAGDSRMEVRVPAWRLTRLGSQIFSICDRAADTAYLWAVGQELKKLGVKVSVGDWVASGDGVGFYSQRLEL